MTDLRPLVALAPVIGLAVSGVVHVAAARLIRGRGPYPPLALGCLAGIAATLAITLTACIREAAAVADTIALASLNGVAALALAFCYFNFVNLTMASLRIRLLEEIRASGGAVSTKTLTGAYNSREVVAIRLRRLVEGGHLVEKDGRLHRGRLPFLIVARIFDGLRWFIFGRRGTKTP